MTSHLCAKSRRKRDQAAACIPYEIRCCISSGARLAAQEGFQGDAFYTAENPPYGAVFTAYLKEKLKTKKEKRQEAEKEAAKKNQALPYPSNDELRAEAQEPKPEVYFLVYDESGQAIRRVEGGTDAGFQRAAWDLRYPAARVKKQQEESEEDFPDAADQGPLVVPGSYSVRMFEKVDGRDNGSCGATIVQSSTENSESMSAADRTAQEEFLKKVARLYRALYGATRTAEDAQDRLKQIREALREIPGAEKQLGAIADSIQQRDREILPGLRGDQEIARRSEPVPSSINDRINSIMEGERFSLAKPTQSHIDQYNIAAAEFGDVLSKLRTLVDVDLTKLEKDMEAAGAPWTPGRVPEWSEK